MNVKGFSWKQRSRMWLDTLILLVLVGAIAFVSSSMLTVLCAVVWALVAVCIGVVARMYWQQKHPKNLCLLLGLLCLSLMAFPVHAQEEGYQNDKIIGEPKVTAIEGQNNKCMVTADAAMASNGEVLISQEKLNEWLNKDHPELKSFDCDCKSGKVTEKDYKSKYESALDSEAKYGQISKWSESDQRKVFSNRCVIAAYEHCQKYSTDYTCKTPRQYIQDNLKDCYTCRITGFTLTAIDLMTASIDNYLRENHRMIKLLAVCFLGWAMWMMACVALGMMSGADFLHKFFVKSILLVMMIAVVSMPLQDVFQRFLGPIANIFAGVSNAIVESGRFEPQLRIDSAPATQYCNSKTWDDQIYLKNLDQASVSRLTTNGSVLPATLKNALVCPVENNFAIVATSLAIGQVLMCSSTKYSISFSFNPVKAALAALARKFHWPRIGMWLSGLFILTACYLLMFFLPFFLIDAFFCMSLFFVPFPIWCLAAMYKPSRGFAKRAFILFIHSLLCLITVSLAAMLINQILDMYLMPDPETAAKINAALTSGQGSVEELAKIFSLDAGGLAKDVVSDLKELDIGGALKDTASYLGAWGPLKSLVLLSMVVVMGWKMLSVGQSIAATISGVSLSSVASSTASEAKSTKDNVKATIDSAKK